MSETMSDADLKRLVDELINEAFCGAHEVLAARKGNQPNEALFAIFVHIAHNWKAVAVLHDYVEKHDMPGFFLNPATSLNRSMYDAFLQALYLVHDPSMAEKLAADYFNFGIIEHVKFVKALDSNESLLAKKVATSPMRAASEKEWNKAFSQVEAQFRKSKKSRGWRWRDKWYEGNLRDLAEKTGRLREYDFNVAYSHASVHANPHATLQGPIWTPAGLLFNVCYIASQAVDLLRRHLGVELSCRGRRLIEALSRGMFDEDHQ
jgi:hypothetical protein